MSFRRACTLMAAVAVVVALAACGGGGTTTTTSSTTTSGLNDYALPSNARIFMKFGDGTITNLTGDATLRGYENWIQLANISLNVVREFVQSAHAGTQDIFTGVANLNPIEMSKSVDSSSAGLLKSAWGGGAIGGMTGTATISVLAGGAADADPTKLEVYKIDLVAPVIASFSQSIDSGGVENLSIWYTKIKVTWQPINPQTGLVDTTKRIVVGWDRIANKPWTG